MMCAHTSRTARLVLAGLLLTVASPALADISPVIFHIEASNEFGSVVFEVMSDELVPDPATGGQKWTLDMAQELSLGPAPEDLIATLENASLTVVDDTFNYPRIIMNFQLQAGLSDAEFLVESPLVSFSTLGEADSAGRATAGFSLSDFSDGIPAMLQGLDPGSGLGIFTAQYNGFVPTGTQFANLIAELGADSGGTISASDSFPASGFAAIGENVDDISVMYGFTLTANDLMSGQNTFVVFPEPAGIALILLAVAGIRRRR